MAICTTDRPTCMIKRPVYDTNSLRGNSLSPWMLQYQHCNFAQAQQQRLSVGSTPGLNGSFNNGFGQLPGGFAAVTVGLSSSSALLTYGFASKMTVLKPCSPASGFMITGR